MNTQARSLHPEYQVGVKAFLARDLKLFRKILRSPKLTLSEELLLKAREFFLEQNWSEALKVLRKISVASLSFLDAERHFLSATANFQIGDIEISALLNLRAAKIYSELSDRRGSFLSLHNLMVDYSRLGLSKIAQVHYEEALKVAEGSAEKILLARALACEESRAERYDSACLLIEAALRENQFLAPTDRHTLSSVASDIFFRAGKIEQALELLKIEKAEAGDSGYLKNVERGRIEFDLQVIEALIAKRRLGKAPMSLAKFPRYQNQWDLLLALQGGEIDRAQKLWKNLQTAQPGLFGNNFECIDASESKTAFWTYLSHLDQRTRSLDAPKVAGKVKVLYELLHHSRAPIRKETLIEKLWDTPYDPAFDARLYKLIERAKHQGIEIVNLQRAYTLKS